LDTTLAIYTGPSIFLYLKVKYKTLGKFRKISGKVLLILYLVPEMLISQEAHDLAVKGTLCRSLNLHVKTLVLGHFRSWFPSIDRKCAPKEVSRSEDAKKYNI